MNNKNGFPYLTQSDPRWAKEIMTHPEWQEKPDAIGQYFCLNTSFLNIYNDYYHQTLNPSLLNKMIIAKSGYYYLKAKKQYKNLNDVKAACFKKESYVDIPTVCELLNIKSIERDYTGKIVISDPKTYYIIKVPMGETGHYCNIVSEDKKYFDVYDGKIKTPNRILSIIKVNF